MTPPPQIFPIQPELRDTDRRKLAFGNDHLLRAWLKTPGKPDDLKRAILVELERPAPRQPVMHRLLNALQRAERNEIGRAIGRHLAKKH